MNEEKVDLVDANGIIVLKNILRSEANTYSGYYLPIIIGVIFDDSGRIVVHQRAFTKKVNPGDIDHICGAIASGETPEQALTREALEETGLQLDGIKLVTKGVNRYGRFRYLFKGHSNDRPREKKTTEVEWVKFISPDELTAKQRSGDFSFVKDFFEDTALALKP